VKNGILGSGLMGQARDLAGKVILTRSLTMDEGDAGLVVYCGDAAGAKKIAAQLIRDVGFEPMLAYRFEGHGI
jgi:hypothetical protein